MAPPPEPPSASPSASGAQPGNRAVLAVVGLGTLLSAMAGSTVNLALPSLGQEMGISIEQSRWVLQSFLLTVAALLLPMGRLSDLVGHRRVYLGGFALFGAGSLACGLSGSFGALVATRVLQGGGSAMMMATGPALLTLHTPRERRGRSLGILSSATYVGLTLGPPLGGLLVGRFGWQSIFLLNVPVALLVLAVGLRWLPGTAASPSGRPQEPFDRWGAGLMVMGLPLALVALNQGSRWGWTSMGTLATGLVGAGLLASFLVHQRRTPAPLLDLGLFRSRVFTTAATAALANYIAIFSFMLLMPFYLVEGLGFSTERTGLFLSVQPVVMALVASPAGGLSDRIGNRGLGVAGMVLLGLALLGMGGLGPGSSSAWIMGLLGLAGLGTGIFISPNSSALMGAAPPHRQGAAGSILGVARTLGMLLGVTLAAVVFHLAGGRTGVSWAEADFKAMNYAIFATAGAALVAAVVAAFGGERREGPLSSGAFPQT